MPSLIPRKQTLPVPNLRYHLSLSPDLEIASPVEAATVLGRHAGVPIEDKPLVTLTPLKAPPAAAGGAHQGSTGEVTGASAELIVTVWWAGYSWGKREKNQKKLIVGTISNCAGFWSKCEGFQKKGCFDLFCFVFNLTESFPNGRLFPTFSISIKTGFFSV